jgi:hypothetical protein
MPLPRSERQLQHLAYHRWILAFDHISGIAAKMREALCRLATGTAFFLQETPSEQPVPHDLRRPIVLTVDEKFQAPLTWPAARAW